MRLTLATQLTLLRLIGAPVFVFLLLRGQTGWAMLVFGLASLTDTFDGLVARKLGQQTPVGIWLDPLADKVLLTCAFVSLSLPFLTLTYPIPLWLVITSIVRDILIAIGALVIRAARGLKQFPPTMTGKISTTLQMVTVCASLIGNYLGTRFPFFDSLIYATLLFTVVSGLDYLRRGVQMLRRPQADLEHA
jgi:cardiolipin synthase (CMP-forming)